MIKQAINQQLENTSVDEQNSSAIDFGNSKTKVGIIENKQITKVIEINSNEISVDVLKKIFTEYNIQKSIFLTVIKLNEDILNYLRENNSIQFTHNFKLPFESHYKPLSSLGIDRLAGVVGGYYLFPEKNFMVIQCGTCITYDFFHAPKGHLGGVISPGIRLRAQSMNKFTHLLPLVEIQENEKFYVYEDNTIGAIKSGILQGIMFEITGYITEASKFLGDDFITILSGGDMHHFADKIKNKIFAQQNINLIGLSKLLI